MEEKKKKEKHSWPIYVFLTIIIFLLFMILVSIYYFCSVFYSWAQYSLEQEGYFVQEGSYNNTIENAIINTTPIINTTVD